jgi:hypothetical protein
MPKLRRPSPALLVACLALAVAVVGTAAAAPQTRVIVRKGEIAKGAVTRKALAPGAVGTRALAEGAVHAKALAAGAVGAAALHPGSVGQATLAPDAVTSGALAPGSVYGGALGEVSVHTAPIVDADAVAHNGEWTASQAAIAMCGAGERILSGGVVVPESADSEIGILASQPFVNGSQNGWTGRVTSDTGGLAKAEVEALCLR